MNEPVSANQQYARAATRAAAGTGVSDEVLPSDAGVLSLLPGQRLRNARERLGLTKADVCNRLHLLPAVIDDIERDSYGPSQYQTYMRGYLKNYAREVGLCTDDIVNTYDQMLRVEVPSEQDPQATPYSVEPMYSAPSSRMLKPWRLKFIRVLLMWLVAIAVVAVPVWLLTQMESPPFQLTQHVEVETRDGKRFVEDLSVLRPMSTDPLPPITIVEDSVNYTASSELPSDN